MKKVFLIHGFEGMPNGGWRPWLMSELEKKGIYACALAMPDPYAPVRDAWVGEVARHVEGSPSDEIYLVGHSLGVPTILRFLEGHTVPNVKGAVLVAGPVEPTSMNTLDPFLSAPFNYKAITAQTERFAVIHGDTDTLVPFAHAERLSKELACELIPVANGGHLNGSSGFHMLPPALEALEKMMV